MPDQPQDKGTAAPPVEGVGGYRLRSPYTGERLIRVLYLDLDGTVRQGKDDALDRFVNGPEDVVVFPEAVERMREWKAAGGRIVACSNQGGIALGIVSAEKVAAAMLETQRQTGNLFDKILWCRHHPGADDPEMARCWCRKPSPGLVIDAAYEISERFRGICPPYLGLFVGDRPEDEECARLAGLPFMPADVWRAGTPYPPFPGRSEAEDIQTPDDASEVSDVG